METRKWETQTLSVVVKPEGDPVYSELATTIEITDEAAGPFIEVRQAGKDLGKVRFDVDEWEVVKAAIDHMVGICKSIVA